MKLFHDARGWSGEIWHCPYGGSIYKTDYWAHSHKGVLRGLHYRTPAQFGLLTVISGRILDVMAGIKNGVWRWRELQEGEQVEVPTGVAHGYYVMSDWADVVYKLSEYWAPECEHGIAWNDPTLAIKWPTDNPILSERDSKWPALSSLAA